MDEGREDDEKKQGRSAVSVGLVRWLVAFDIRTRSCGALVSTVNFSMGHYTTRREAKSCVSYERRSEALLQIDVETGSDGVKARCASQKESNCTTKTKLRAEVDA